MDLVNMHPKDVRKLIREGKVTSPTSGMCKGYIQDNLAIFPKKNAYDFLLFAQINPKTYPILEVTDVGNPFTKITADKADIRYDVTKYRIYKKGELVDEVLNLENYQQDDFVSFLIGCSFSFESAIMDAKIPIRHIEDNHNVPMYITNIPSEEVGIFHGNMVVSMRPIKYKDIVRTTTVTAMFPATHGSPIHIGYPKIIDIEDIYKPDFGERPEIREGEVPVFWPCGVTPQSVALTSKPDIMIIHSPGHMLILDLVDSDVRVF